MAANNHFFGGGEGHIEFANREQMKEYLKGMLEDTDSGGYWDYNMLLPVVKV